MYICWGVQDGSTTITSKVTELVRQFCINNRLKDLTPPSREKISLAIQESKPRPRTPKHAIRPLGAVGGGDKQNVNILIIFLFSTQIKILFIIELSM